MDMKTRSPKMPPARQRRLDTLIDRAKTQGLTLKEEAELQEMLEDVDRKSFWLVARLIARQNGKPSATSRGPNRVAAAR